MNAWICLEIPSTRNYSTLNLLSDDTLAYGLKFLRQQIAENVAMDSQLYNQWHSLLSISAHLARDIAYAGWCRRPSTDEAVDS
ncbi:hypothetical protein K469DRAFT_13355 [Zopfia rhizophila CBS 207.26]|uniref:Uncharacterized protein n=1 Tax=Zopfia rhizophila CBS 207.26 TaxID=1314779 RepID=A0A6A6EZD1_9PEZI|nr:hypothetical protein K469DRAFT_13355 [Zopfia rhizophila CBS 207.26]